MGYENAQQKLPKLLYVDRGCCPTGDVETSYRNLFEDWHGLEVSHERAIITNKIMKVLVIYMRAEIILPSLANFLKLP